MCWRKKQTIVGSIVTAAMLWPFLPAAAQLLARRGGEFRINETSIVGTRFTLGSRVAAAPGGGFVVVWDNEEGDGDGWGVFAKRFAPDGEPIDQEFLVNSTTTGDQQQPHVAVGPDGSFLIVWSSEPGFPLGQVFDPDGARRGSEITFTEPEVNGPPTSVAATEDGDFVVVLTDFIGPGYEVRARRVDRNGVPVAPSFPVSEPDGLGGQMFGAIAMHAGDSFLVVWYDETKSQMRARHFSGAQATGPEQFVSFVSNASAGHPGICGNSEGFIVTWEADDVHPFEGAIDYRRYGPNGEAVIAPQRVNMRREMVLFGQPAAACADSDTFTIVWSEVEGEHYDVVGQVFSQPPARFRIGAAFRPSVAFLSAEDFVVVWNDCLFDLDTPRCDVFGQRFTLTGSSDCPGDCDRNGVVTVNELLLAVKAALTAWPDDVRRCLAADASLNYRIAVEELVEAVARSLRGC